MQGLRYEVDVALCIDATASMAPVIDMVKANALRFAGDLLAAMAKKEKKIDRLRVRIIVFRDFFHDPKNALETTDFMVLPEQNAAFGEAVRRITATGGDDEPESALEALAVAMRSDWGRSGDKRRHVIVMWTDASAHRLEDAAKRAKPGYPTGLPASLTEFMGEWEGQKMDTSAKRLLVYAPDAYPWNQFADFENTLHFPSQAGKGLEEHDYAAVLETIANSI